MSTPTHLLYFHGFRSSPASAKARQVAARLAELADAPLWLCPQLPASPRDAMAAATALLDGVDPRGIALIGSSLGGYYAAALAARLGCRAALLNPAVDPARDLSARIGTQSCWHEPQLRFEFTARHVDELRAIDPGEPDAVAASRLLVVVSRDDEVLDWREMTQRYRYATLRVAEHGGHALDDFAQHHLDAVLEFLGIAIPPSKTDR
jgi:predicted esterase YcpF (UPF0227 family)